MSEMITPASSLLKYDTPVIILNNNVERALRGNKPKQEHSTRPLSMPTNGHLEPIKSQKAEDILPKILPPKIFEDKGHLWLQQVSADPATNLDVKRLGLNLDKRLLTAKAKETGICPFRRRLYAQAFDELIRQVTINCVERGLLMLRARDEINVTLDAFQTLYESATGYGLRKALNTKKGELEGQKREIDLEEQIEESHNEIEKIKGLIGALKSRGVRERKEIEEKHEEEIQFLLRINEKRRNQLSSILA